MLFDGKKDDVGAQKRDVLEEQEQALYTYRAAANLAGPMCAKP